MTTDDLIEILTEQFYENFANAVATRVLENDAFETLFRLNIDCDKLKVKKSIRDKIAFRSSYVLETIYFADKECFAKFQNEFFEHFPLITNGGMMRHYAKICADLLNRGVRPTNEESIAKACLSWVLDPKVRVAVKIWAVEILVSIKDRVELVREVLPEIIDVLSSSSMPALECRIRSWKNRLSIESNTNIF